MQHYKTLTEAKKNLPEIVDRINTCKIYFDVATMMLEDMQRWCVQETVDESVDHGCWTTLSMYAETVKNQMSYYAEIEYLDSIVKKIQQHPEL